MIVFMLPDPPFSLGETKFSKTGRGPFSGGPCCGKRPGGGNDFPSVFCIKREGTRQVKQAQGPLPRRAKFKQTRGGGGNDLGGGAPSPKGKLAPLKMACPMANFGRGQYAILGCEKVMSHNSPMTEIQGNQGGQYGMFRLGPNFRVHRTASQALEKVIRGQLCLGGGGQLPSGRGMTTALGQNWTLSAPSSARIP